MQWAERLYEVEFFTYTPAFLIFIKLDLHYYVFAIMKIMIRNMDAATSERISTYSDEFDDVTR